MLFLIITVCVFQKWPVVIMVLTVLLITAGYIQNTMSVAIAIVTPQATSVHLHSNSTENPGKHETSDKIHKVNIQTNDKITTLSSGKSLNLSRNKLPVNNSSNNQLINKVHAKPKAITFPRRKLVNMSNAFPPEQYGRSRYDGKWTFFNSTMDIFAYSAFYDDRQSLGSFPMVRVITVMGYDGNHDTVPVFCVLYYAGREPVVVSGVSDAIGFGVNQDGKNYKEYVVTCRLQSETIPDAVVLTCNRHSISDRAIPIEIPQRPNKNEKKFAFGVCVSVSYWSFDAKRLVEWLEMQHILGASLVTIYNNTISDPTARVFQYYKSKGFVDFRQSHNFIPYRYEQTIHLHMSPVINDCIYRNMHRFGKLLIIDLDELIMPQNGFTLSDLVQEIEQTQGRAAHHPARSYAFRNIYMFFNSPPDMTQPESLVTLRYRNQAKPSPKGYSTKSMIDPQACTRMHNHYCWGFTKLYDTQDNYIEVDPNTGANRHYKKCHFSKTECKAKLAEVTRNDAALKYKAALELRTKMVFEDLGLTGTDT